jgi:demethylmenaquinone methyltransferase/2-methoxy-6-polyprenyl-1,4-benzoquinol methylase
VYSVVKSSSEISRVVRTHAVARAGYDRLSGWYDLLEGGWEAPIRRQGLELLNVRAGERVLEIGCGTGAALELIPGQACAVGRAPCLSAWGLDLSRGMLAQARTRLKKTGNLAALVQGDALRLPFQTASFDAIFTAFTLELIDTPEIPLALAETRRVLRPGGRLGVVSLSKLGGWRWMQRLYEWSHARFPNAVDCRPIYARQALAQAGFRETGCRLLSRTGLGMEIVVVEK